MPTTLIKNATVAFPDGQRPASVLLEGHAIAAIDPAAHTQADETIDASGLHLLPGVIDTHVHFRDPGITHKEDLHTGSLACARGGVTSFVEMPNTVPPAVDQAGIDAKLAIAAKKSVVNYGFYIAATPNNTVELANAQRVAGIKIFIGSSTGDLLVDDQDDLERIFAETRLPICAHCEDETLVQANAARLAEAGWPGAVADHSRVRDHKAAIVCTERAIDLATHHNRRFHVLHVSTADEVPAIRAARGIVTGEACPHHLLFNTSDYDRLGTRVQMNPAIKTDHDNAALWDALRNGTLQMVVTDHAPHTLEEKAQPYPRSPSGLPAVENSLSLMLDAMHKGRCTLGQIVHWMCEAPALVWDIPNKGRIEEGYDADLVLVDLDAEHTVRNEDQLTKCGWSPWEGESLRGRPVRTIVGGRTVYLDGKVDADHRGKPLTYDHARGGYWAAKPTLPAD
jgi:dihydroorotase